MMPKDDTTLQLGQPLPRMVSQPLQRSAGGASIVEALFRQRWSFLLAASLVFGLALLWTFATAKRFDSEMVLLVQNARGGEILTPGQNGINPTMNDVSEEQLNSEVAVLNSDDVLNDILDPNWARKASLPADRNLLLHHEKALRSLRSRLEVTPVRNSHVITVKLDAPSPELARGNLIALLQAFLRKQQELGRLPGASGVFSRQAEAQEQELQKARHDLADYQNEHGFVSLDTQEATLSGKISDLEGAGRSTDSEISELQSRISADRQQIASLPERQSTLSRTLPSTQTIDQLNVLLVTLRNRKTELLTKFKPDDRLVREIDQQIADTTAGLRQASAAPPAEISTDVNPLWEAARRDLNTSEVTLNGLLARHERLESQVGALTSGLGSVEQQSGRFNALQLRVQELEARYRAFAQKRDESQMSDLMDQQQWLNVAVVEYPTFSPLPSHPQPVLDLTLGLLTALLVGGCVVFLLEAVRQEVSTPAELEQVSQYPVLATVPFAPKEPLRSIRQRSSRRTLSGAISEDGLAPQTTQSL